MIICSWAKISIYFFINVFIRDDFDLEARLKNICTHHACIVRNPHDRTHAKLFNPQMAGCSGCCCRLQSTPRCILSILHYTIITFNMLRVNAQFSRQTEKPESRTRNNNINRLTISHPFMQQRALICKSSSNVNVSIYCKTKRHIVFTTLHSANHKMCRRFCVLVTIQNAECDHIHIKQAGIRHSTRWPTDHNRSKLLLLNRFDGMV